ncbi:MAG TPA: PAS domain-containing sensor histidine kinase [Candidatus Binatus sp.]|nr:PAS domain-containing sensor histidine kinase [Candidatus Binatus sp.]
MKAHQTPLGRLELEDLQQRLREAEETLDAIRSGEVDALVVAGPSGEKIFTLTGAEHPYRVLVESMNEGAVSLSTSGVILYGNSAFARMVGIPLDQIMGTDLAQFVPAQQRESLTKLIAQGSRESVRAEMIVEDISGGALPTQFSLNPIKLEEGTTIGVVVTDMSERKRHEQAEAAVRMRDEFLAIASHELRTPLSTLMLRLGLVERYAAKGELDQVAPAVVRAQDQAARIGRLVDRLLDVSQLAKGKIELQLAVCDLGEIAEGVIERLLEQASNAGSKFSLSIALGVTVRADKFRLEEAISNVVINAIKFGRGRPVDIELTSRDATAVLTVQDRGIGIPPEDLSRIFGRFEQTTTSRNYGGLGLGLYIANQIIEQHGGTIRAENRRNGGASIVIEIPRLADARRRN